MPIARSAPRRSREPTRAAALALLALAIVAPMAVHAQTTAAAKEWPAALANGFINAAVVHMAGIQRVAVVGGQRDKTPLATAFLLDVSRPFSVDAPAAIWPLPNLPKAVTRPVPLVAFDAAAREYRAVLVGGQTADFEVSTDVYQYSLAVADVTADSAAAKVASIKTVDKDKVPATPAIAPGVSDVCVNATGAWARAAADSAAWFGGLNPRQSDPIADASVVTLTGDLTKLQTSGPAPAAQILGRTIRIDADRFLVTGGADTVATNSILNVRTGTWTALPALRTGRDEHQVVVYTVPGSSPAKRYAVVLGDGNPMIETIDLDTNALAQATPTGDGPANVARGSAVLVDDHIMIFGGSNQAQAGTLLKPLTLLKIKVNGAALEFEWTKDFKPAGYGKDLILASSGRTPTPGTGGNATIEPNSPTTAPPALPYILGSVGGGVVIVVLILVARSRRRTARENLEIPQYSATASAFQQNNNGRYGTTKSAAAAGALSPGTTAPPSFHSSSATGSSNDGSAYAKPALAPRINEVAVAISAGPRGVGLVSNGAQRMTVSTNSTGASRSTGSGGAGGAGGMMVSAATAIQSSSAATANVAPAGYHPVEPESPHRTSFAPAGVSPPNQAPATSSAGPAIPITVPVGPNGLPFARSGSPVPLQRSTTPTLEANGGGNGAPSRPLALPRLAPALPTQPSQAAIVSNGISVQDADAHWSNQVEYPVAATIAESVPVIMRRASEPYNEYRTSQSAATGRRPVLSVDTAGQGMPGAAAVAAAAAALTPPESTHSSISSTRYRTPEPLLAESRYVSMASTTVTSSYATTSGISPVTTTTATATTSSGAPTLPTLTTTPLMIPRIGSPGPSFNPAGAGGPGSIATSGSAGTWSQIGVHFASPIPSAAASPAASSVGYTPSPTTAPSPQVRRTSTLALSPLQWREEVAAQAAAQQGQSATPVSAETQGSDLSDLLYLPTSSDLSPSKTA
ncbi:hypothetical protein H9P43_003491 [Blastocladiella emersonii ATCC 22665]|nr:hypothetical protein H9P43_003491 [Blastocladiella emersonii ATCC 22665]